MSKIIICGKSGAGKDYIAQKYVAKGFKKAITYTTRPKRDYEIDGVHYHFVTDEEFSALKEQGAFIETCNFNNWYYGTRFRSFNSHEENLFIMTPGGIKQLPSEILCKCFVILVTADWSKRQDRSINRGDSVDEVNRRYYTDEKDFEDFNLYDLIINND